MFFFKHDYILFSLTIVQCTGQTGLWVNQSSIVEEDIVSKFPGLMAEIRKPIMSEVRDYRRRKDAGTCHLSQTFHCLPLIVHSSLPGPVLQDCWALPVVTPDNGNCVWNIQNTKNLQKQVLHISSWTLILNSSTLNSRVSVFHCLRNVDKVAHILTGFCEDTFINL